MRLAACGIWRTADRRSGAFGACWLSQVEFTGHRASNRGTPFMTTLQTDSVPSPEEELIETRAPSSAPSSSNRVIVSLAVIGVVGLVLIALAQTVGQDLLVHARRWSRVRKAAPPALSESTATADAAAGDSVAFRQLRHVSNSNAADAQISPPRRRPLMPQARQPSNLSRTIPTGRRPSQRMPSTCPSVCRPGSTSRRDPR